MQLVPRRVFPLGSKDGVAGRRVHAWGLRDCSCAFLVSRRKY